MENKQQHTNLEEKLKKGSIKWKIYLILIVLLVGAGGYGYWWIKDTNSVRAEAELVIEYSRKYEKLRKEVLGERNRCENFIAQKEGDFGSFEYCKIFIDWSDTLPINLN